MAADFLQGTASSGPAWTARGSLGQAESGAQPASPTGPAPGHSCSASLAVRQVAPLGPGGVQGLLRHQPGLTPHFTAPSQEPGCLGSSPHCWSHWATWASVSSSAQWDHSGTSHRDKGPLSTSQSRQLLGQALRPAGRRILEREP